VKEGGSDEERATKSKGRIVRTSSRSAGEVRLMVGKLRL